MYYHCPLSVQKKKKKVSLINFSNLTKVLDNHNVIDHIHACRYKSYVLILCISHNQDKNAFEVSHHPSTEEPTVVYFCSM